MWTRNLPASSPAGRNGRSVPGAAMALGNLDASLSALREHPAVKALGVFDEAGNVDIDKIYTCLKTEAAKGPVTTNIPLIGNVTLNETDVDKLYTLIKQS